MYRQREASYLPAHNASSNWCSRARVTHCSCCGLRVAVLGLSQQGLPRARRSRAMSAHFPRTCMRCPVASNAALRRRARRAAAATGATLDPMHAHLQTRQAQAKGTRAHKPYPMGCKPYPACGQGRVCGHGCLRDPAHLHAVPGRRQRGLAAQHQQRGGLKSNP